MVAVKDTEILSFSEKKTVMAAVKDTEILRFSEKKTVMAAVKDTKILSFSEQKTVMPDTHLSQQRVQSISHNWSETR